MAKGRGKKTSGEKEALDARDRRLQRGLIADDPALTLEAFAIIRRDLFKFAARSARWLFGTTYWDDTRQEVFALIARWQKEGKHLYEDESLWYLMRRALQQVAESLQIDLKWAELADSLDQHESRSIPKQNALEGEAADAPLSPHSFHRPERLAAAREQLAWIRESSQGLSEDDQRVVEAVDDVEHGEHATLGEALGIKDGAARMRVLRVRERLAKAATTEGNREMARRCAGTKYVDGLELLHKAKPGDAHRMSELRLYRDGELGTFKKVALEKHMKRCPGCRRTLRAMAPVETDGDAREPAKSKGDATPQTTKQLDGAVRELRAFGLAYPGAHTKSPSPDQLDLAVNNKTFAYLSVEGEPFSLSCKLPKSRHAALALPFAKPTSVGLAKAGWVTASIPSGEVPVALLKSWIDESYRTLAPKKLVEGLGPPVVAPTSMTLAKAKKRRR